MSWRYRFWLHLPVKLRTRPWRVSACERQMQALGRTRCAHPEEHLLP